MGTKLVWREPANPAVSVEIRHPEACNLSTNGWGVVRRNLRRRLPTHGRQPTAAPVRWLS